MSKLIEDAVIFHDGNWPNENYDSIRFGSESAIIWKHEFNAAADRMRGKPDWKDAPDGYQWLAQNNAGTWWWYPAGKSPELGAVCFNNYHELHAIRATEGAVIGCWTNTLEKRPEQKVDPLNGFKWGVEYPTNGKNPDLPDDIEIEYKNGFHGDSWVGKAFVGSLYFDKSCVGAYPVNFFRITDQRYKPAEPEQAPAKPWFDAGELPKAGTKCLCYFDDGRECWHECFVIGTICSELVNGYLAVSLIGKHERKLIWSNDFRPIATERDKFIGAAVSSASAFGVTKVAEIAGTLFDAGFRLPDQK